MRIRPLQLAGAARYGLRRCRESGVRAAPAAERLVVRPPRKWRVMLRCPGGWPSLALLVFGSTMLGCGPKREPRVEGTLHTEVVLRDTVIAQGQEIAARVVVRNGRASPASFTVDCGDSLSAELVNEDGNCVAGCEAPCPPSTVPTTLVLNSGDSLMKAFRCTYLPGIEAPRPMGVPRSFHFPVPLPPGEYVVRGGIRGHREGSTWAEARVVVR